MKHKEVDRKRSLVFPLLLMLATPLCLASVAFAQTTPEAVPEVVSRDEPVESVPRDRTATRVPSVESRVSNLPVVPQTVAAAPLNLTEAQRKLVFYLDLLDKLESRAENLRTKLLESLEKEISLKADIKRLEFELRDDRINGYAALAGTLRPEETREQRVRLLTDEKNGKEALLEEVTTTSGRLRRDVESADDLVARVRIKFEEVVYTAIDEDLP
ncbi:MAG: hypothetical protein R2684_07030 [Pyrinomonadaceae bacterium]